MEIKPEETMLSGNWKLINGSMKADSICLRIEWLISDYLIEVAKDEAGWNELYQDPTDHRYWELTYPESEMHGGGAPQLKCLIYQEAKIKYPFIENTA